MLSLADPTKYYQLILSQGIGMGFGGGLLMCLTVSMQAHHWDKHLCLAMGIVQAGKFCFCKPNYDSDTDEWIRVVVRRYRLPDLGESALLRIDRLCLGRACFGIPLARPFDDRVLHHENSSAEGEGRR